MKKVFTAFATFVIIVLTVSVASAPATAVVTTSSGKKCTIVGTNRSETLRGTSAADVICGLGGNDVIQGFGGNDILAGGDGNDKLYGGPGNDTLLGDLGNDDLRGGLEIDTFFAGTGENYCELDGQEKRHFTCGLISNPVTVMTRVWGTVLPEYGDRWFTGCYVTAVWFGQPFDYKSPYVPAGEIRADGTFGFEVPTSEIESLNGVGLIIKNMPGQTSCETPFMFKTGYAGDVYPVDIEYPSQKLVTFTVVTNSGLPVPNLPLKLRNFEHLENFSEERQYYAVDFAQGSLELRDDSTATKWGAVTDERGFATIEVPRGIILDVAASHIGQGATTPFVIVDPSVTSRQTLRFD